ncbi:DotI/IcmL family type IV secretion protein [Fangia hongkongensis]|uniref:DotI/IcmL family type IV secretion protein n=2 Tax=Fangia hongkongensis TaxID=270495 RepID=UPI00146EB6AD|nr:DotI/IcmL family type IV secretion protein [Fangia hongkongensis]
MNNNMLKVITEKAYFYKNNFRLMINALLLSLIVIVILTISLIYQLQNVKYYYLAIDKNGEITQLHMKTEADVNETMLTNWVALNIPKLYKLDFVNYKEDILAIRYLFNNYGWQSFNQAFKETIHQIRDKKLVTQAILNGIPVVTAVGQISGVKSWKVQVPIIISFSQGDKETRSRVILKITIQKNSKKNQLSSGQFFGIMQIIQVQQNKD